MVLLLWIQKNNYFTIEQNNKVNIVKRHISSLKALTGVIPDLRGKKHINYLTHTPVILDTKARIAVFTYKASRMPHQLTD